MSLKELGLVKLFLSSKATMALIILICAMVCSLTGHLDSTGFAAVISVVGSVFMWVHGQVNVASINSSAPETVTQNIIDTVRNSIQK